MKKIKGILSLGLVLGLLLAGLSVGSEVGAVGCNYSSTQARVQQSISQPWQREIRIRQGESFRVGSFHDGTGQFANDTRIIVLGPGVHDFSSNEATIRADRPGTYRIWVTTEGQWGDNCMEWASVEVEAYPSEIAECKYGSTQARVQPDEQTDWGQYLELDRGEEFRVGSFHDGTGQFADDTRIKVIGPTGEKEWRNGDRVEADERGIYNVWVTTEGQEGKSCAEVATILVW